MSGYQPTYQPPGDRSTQRQDAGNALSPSPSAQQPPSFRTNVNRKKTTRWVNAKSYAYDGDEWGSGSEDGDSEQGAPEVPAVPGSTGQPNPASESGGHPGFIRPADIYKRMAEEQGQERQGQSTTNQPGSSAEKPMPNPPAEESTKDTPVQYEAVPNTPQTQPQGITQATGVEKSEQQAAETRTDQSHFAGLPELKRLSSGFGPDFMGGESSQPDGSQKDTTSTNKPSVSSPTAEGDLQHNPSVGFRSAVNQAFDTESLARSNSETTAQISPIIRSGQMPTPHDTRVTEKGTTPTIEEEPSDRRRESGTADFKPGYRRSLTPPSRDNSPARRPVVVPARQPTTQSEFGQVSDDQTLRDERQKSDPSASPLQPTSNVPVETDERQSSHPSGDPSGASVERDRQSSELQSPYSVPAHQPDVNPDQTIADTQRRESSVTAESNSRTTSGAVNDMLHDQIVRSLAANPSAARESPKPHEDAGPAVIEPTAPTRQESTLLPSEHDSYWNEKGGGASADPYPVSGRVLSDGEEGTMPDRSSSPSASQAVPTVPPSQNVNDPSSSAPERPKFEKRFSWEQSSDEEDVTKPQPGAPVGADHPVADPQENSLSNASTEPKELRTISPVGSFPSPGEQDAAREGDPDMPSAPSDSGSGVIVVPGQAQPLAQQVKVADFREIMAMNVHGQKLSSFDDSTRQILTADTGLESWIQHIAASSPDHAAVIALNSQVPADADLSQRATSRPKFPKISSLGTLSLPSQHRESSNKSSHTRQASGAGLSGQQVQAKGKDLLHGAGVLGGRAGGAAKGLFAKGRSKFRNSGSGDKVYSNSPSSHNSLSRSSTTAGFATGPRGGSTTSSRAHLPQYQSLHNRPLPDLPSTRHSSVSQNSEGVTQPTAHAPDQSPRSFSLTSIQNPPRHWTGEQDTENFQSAPKLAHPLATEHRRSPSPVSTLGMVSDIGRPGYGDDPDHFRAGSISTIGEYGDTPTDFKPQPDPDMAHVDNDKPSSTAAPAEIFYNQEEPVDARPGRESEDIAGPEPPPKDGHDSARSVTPADSKPADSATTASSSHKQPGSCTDIRTSSHEDNYTSKEAPGSSNDVEVPVLSDASNASVEFPRSPNVQAQPMHIMEASQYREIVDRNKDGTAKSTNVPRTSSQVRPQDKPMPPVPESPEHTLFGPPAATATSVSVSQPTQNNMPPYAGNKRHEAAHVNKRASYIPPSSLSAFPQPPRQTQSAPTSAVRTRNNAPFQPGPSRGSPGHDGPAGTGTAQHSTLSSISGTGFSGLLSKIQTGRRGSSGGSPSPALENQGPHNPHVPGKEMQNLPKTQSDLSNPARAGTFPLQGSKKSVIPKVLRRSSGMERPANSRTASLGKLNTLLGRSPHQASSSAVEPRLATHYEVSHQPPTHNDTQQYGESQYQPPPTSHAPRQRYYQASRQPPTQNKTQPYGDPRYQSQTSHAPGQRSYQQDNHAQRPNDNRNDSGEETVEYYAPGVVESTEPSSGVQTPDNVQDNNNTQPSQMSGTTTYPSTTAYAPTYTPGANAHVSTSSSPVQAGNTLPQSPPEGHRKDWSENPQDKSYTAHLHIRSRSPLDGHTADTNKPERPVNGQSDPAQNLGTFHATSPKVDRVGDQETPWNLTIPRDDEGTRKKEEKPEIPTASPVMPSRYPLPGSTAMSPINPAAADMAPPSPPKSPSNEQHIKATAPAAATQAPSTSSALAVHEVKPEQGMATTPPEDVSKEPQPRPPLHESDPMEPVELPVPGDDSSEEVVMSSTAYPGQEWQPSFVGTWD